MENAFSFEEGSDMSYEDSALPSPVRLTPPGQIYDLESRMQEEEDNEPPMEAVVIPYEPGAYMNVNTNATTRGDAQAYVELNELQGNSWQETSRWMGYEENLNTATGKWGPSHVSYLTFKSLLQLRKTMSTGAVIFDLNAGSLSAVAEKVVDELLNKNEIRASDRDGLLRALLMRRSQSEGPVVTPSGDIEMQTFSVSKKRDGSENMEASVVLSGVLDILEKPVVAFVRLSDSVVMESALESPIPVRFVYVLVGPRDSGMDYRESGRAMGALMADWVFCLEAFLAQTDKDLTNAISDFMDCSIVIPPTEIQDQGMLEPIIQFQRRMLRERVRPSDTRLAFGDRVKVYKAPEEPREDPLARTGYPFGGMVRDLKRRFRHYISDYTDALNPQVLAAVIFIYFAALSPAITFGGLLADKTEKMMGVSELMVSTCIQGVIFCLISAQPVLIIGFSGPLLVFEEAFYAFCKSQGIEYIVGRIWVGMWLVLIVIIIVAVEGSFLVRFISRFTQEIFSILISLIFIYETFSKLFKIFKTHPLILNYDHLNDSSENPFHPIIKEHVEFHGDGNVTIHELEIERPYPNTALLSMCLMFGCFFIAYFLRSFKTGHFLPGPIRRLIGDFGVPIAIFFMIAVDISIEDAYTQKLVVPKGVEVTNPAVRGWFINPMGEKKPFPIWMMGASCVPALLVFILIFLESQITTLIVSKPERKMMKGSGFHWDLLILVTCDIENDFYFRYPSFQDVHVMIFVGFGFLMTFLKRYSFGAVGFNFLIAAFGLQWALLMQGWFHSLDYTDGKIKIGVENLINADFCVAGCLIAYGAVLGKVSPVQLMVMTLFGVTLFAVEEYIILNLIHARDAGGSMVIHTFGGYYGLSISWMLYRPNLDQSSRLQGSCYHSDVFAMIGTLFLWMFWPSFNSAITDHGDGQHRAAINTYLALASTVLTTVAISSLFQKHGKLDMVHIQNSTLAGGVAVGTAAEFMLMPYGSLIVGFCCGIISTLGYIYLTPFMEKHLKIQDTCGIHNLHAMPGVIGGIVGAITAAAATESVYGREGLVNTFDFEGAFKDMVPTRQGGHQAAGLCVAICFGIGGGILVGCILRLPIWGDAADDNCFDDEPYWELPEDEESVPPILQYNNHMRNKDVEDSNFTMEAVRT